MNQSPQSTLEQEPQLSEEQATVMELFKTQKNILITGAAGTGKSFLLRHLAEASDQRLPVVATTGIAAVGVGGMTIHSWAGIGIAQEDAKTLARRIIDRRGDPCERIRKYNRLAIDEISMMSRELFDKLDWVFRYVRKVEDRPFGGMQILTFGDFLQLPPVTRDLADDRNRFCFSAEAWRAGKFQTVMLTKVFRQSDAAWSGALNDIRRGHISENARALLNSRAGRNAADTMPEIKAVTVYTHNSDVDGFNWDKLCKLEGEERAYEAQDNGREKEIEMLRRNCLAPTRLVLKIGAQVMLLKNLDPLSGLANGSIGTVVGFSTHGKLPEVKFAERVVTLDRQKWDIKHCGTTLATRHQIPLRLAWAITVHKSQGMSLDKIEVFLDRVFEDGQAYVALSRARTLGGLFIRTGGKAAIRANAEALAFYGL